MSSTEQTEMLNKAVLSLREKDWPMLHYSESGYNVYKGKANVVIDRTKYVELTYNLCMLCRVPIDDPFFERKIPKILPPHMIVKYIRYDFLPELIETKTIKRITTR